MLYKQQVFHLGIYNEQEKGEVQSIERRALDAYMHDPYVLTKQREFYLGLWINKESLTEIPLVSIKETLSEIGAYTCNGEFN